MTGRHTMGTAARRTVIGAVAATATLLSLAAPAWAAGSASSEEIARLRSTLAATQISDLKPLASASGDDSARTARYDTARPNAADVARLEKSREAARALVDSTDPSQADVTAARQKLQSDFDAVRFVYHYTSVTGTQGDRIFDNNGNLLQAHGAGIVRAKTSLLPKSDQGLDANHDGSIYIMVGEDKTDRLVARGPHIYYSDDLLNWTDKGLGFEMYHGKADLQKRLAGSDPTYKKYYNVANIEKDPDYTTIYGKDFGNFKDDWSNNNISSAQDVLTKSIFWDLKALKGDGEDKTASSAVYERPKLAYNTKTKRWVLWFHADGPQYDNENTATYSKAKAGVAISEGSDPAGPYKYLGSFRLGPGNNTSNPGMARDMNLFVDDKDANKDGVPDAYLIYSSNENKDLTISLLDSTYTKLVKPVSQQKMGTSVADGDTYNVVATDSKEAPAPFKYDGHYYIVYSGTTGWYPNENKYEVSQSDSILGPYDQQGTPFVKGSADNQDPGNSFFTQASMMIPYDESKGIFLYWGDRWFNPDTGNDISQSRYVMVPAQLVNGRLKILPAADWPISQAQEHPALTITQKFPTTASSVSEVRAQLPATVSYTEQGSTGTKTTPVVWDSYEGPDKPTQPVRFTGTLPKLGGAQVDFTVDICPKGTVLFMDAGSDPSNESGYYTTLRAQDPDLTNTTVSDQQYDPASGRTWGHSSTIGTDDEVYGSSDSDIFETGLWAHKDKEIDYKADLPAGTYSTMAGYKEWWASTGNKRRVAFSVEKDGSELGSTSITPSASGNATDPVTFTLDKPATVTFRSRQINGGDPLLSWISVRKSAGTDIASVTTVSGTTAVLAGSDPASSLPSDVEVTLENGTTARRHVTWHVDADSLPALVPTRVSGTIAGTGLPASATVQKIPAGLEYLIDVNGGASSPTYARAKALEPGLLNASADQTYTDGAAWGNASVKYGLQHTGDEDPYVSGIDAESTDTQKNTPLSYVLTLAAGRHRLNLGLYDWWSWEDRPISATYSWEGKDPAKLTDDVTLWNTKGKGSAKTVMSGVIDVPEGGKKVTITLSSPTGTGPVLSWISAAKDTSSPAAATVTSADSVAVSGIAGKTPALPSQVTVHLSDGTTATRKVTWATDDWVSEKPGLVVLTGSVEGADVPVSAFVTLAQPLVAIDQRPVISGADGISISVGDTFDPKQGVTASDPEDGDLTSKIRVTGSVDTSKAGTYNLVYTVADSQGVSTSVQRTVTVTKASTPGESIPWTQLQPSTPAQPDTPSTPCQKSGSSDSSSKTGQKGGKRSASSASAKSASKGGLADTGSAVIGIAAAAVLLVGAGLALAVGRRHDAAHR